MSLHSAKSALSVHSAKSALTHKSASTERSVKSAILARNIPTATSSTSSLSHAINIIPLSDDEELDKSMEKSTMNIPDGSTEIENNAYKEGVASEKAPSTNEYEGEERLTSEKTSTEKAHSDNLPENEVMSQEEAGSSNKNAIIPEEQSPDNETPSSPHTVGNHVEETAVMEKSESGNNLYPSTGCGFFQHRVALSSLPHLINHVLIYNYLIKCTVCLFSAWIIQILLWSKYLSV